MTDSPVLEALPQVLHGPDAAVLVVDRATGLVEYANLRALAMSGDHLLPIPVDEWGRRAGLRNADGADLAESPLPLSRVAWSEPVSGQLVRRDPGRASGAAAGEQLRQRTTGEGTGEDVTGALWVTGFPLGEAMERRALVVFLALPAEQISAQGVGDVGAAMRERAVVATDLSFTITDPHAPDNPLVWVNPAFLRATGYAMEEVLGRNCRFLQGPATDASGVRRLREAVDARLPAAETLVNYRKDGTPFWNQISITPVLDAEGRLVNFVGVQADVTEQVLVHEQRAQAFATEQRARARLTVLDLTSRAVAGLSPDDGLRGLADLLVQQIAPWAAVLVPRGRRVRVVAVSGLPDARSIVGAELADSGGDDPLAAMVAGQGAGEARIDLTLDWPVGSVTAWLARCVGDSERQCTALTLPGRAEPLALLVVGGPDPGADDAALLREIVGRAALGLENALLYEREHALSEALQRALLPEVTAVPGLDIWASYTPNLDHTQVGGDWFDILQTDDDTAVVVVGDVVGHDILATSTMGQVRSVIRSCAYEIDDPAGVLMRTEQLILGMSLTRLTTVVIGVLHRLTGGSWRLTWSSAGHLPGLMRRHGTGDTRVEALGGALGPLLGLGDGPRRSETTVLHPGDALVLYTDGLVERRGLPMTERIGLLSSALADARGDAAMDLGQVLLGVMDGSPEDDAALLVVRVPGVDEPAEAHDPDLVRQRRWHLPPGPASIGRARRAVVQACRDWQVPRAAEAELIVSELVTNAVVHAGGDVGLRLHVDRGGLRIEIEDGNARPPQVAQGRPLGEGGYGLRVVQKLSTWGWYPTRIGKVIWSYMRADAPQQLTPR